MENKSVHKQDPVATEGLATQDYRY